MTEVLEKIKNYCEKAKKEPATAEEINMAFEIEEIINKEEKNNERNKIVRT